MNDKEGKRCYAGEGWTVLGMLLVLTFICRLWPVLLLFLIGIFAAALRLLFLGLKRKEAAESLSFLPEPAKEAVKEPTEQDVRELAYAVILRQITELVLSRYPQARWVWEVPNARMLLEQGEEVFILLNRAGGYRRARVVMDGFRVADLAYGPLELMHASPRQAGEDTGTEGLEEEKYELLAFEWVEANILELNVRCNEAIGRGLAEYLLMADELPVRESWPDICRELVRSGLEEVSCISEGLKIRLA